MVQTIKIEFSINSDTLRSQIEINVYVTGHVLGMIYDSKTQLIQFVD